jgi:hypothetical protein
MALFRCTPADAFQTGERAATQRPRERDLADAQRTPQHRVLGRRRSPNCRLDTTILTAKHQTAARAARPSHAFYVGHDVNDCCGTIQIRSRAGKLHLLIGPHPSDYPVEL